MEMVGEGRVGGRIWIRVEGREPARRLVRIVARREHPFWPRKVGEAAAEEKVAAEFVGLLFGLVDEDRLQVTEILRARLVSVLRRFRGIEVPHFERRLEHRGERDVRLLLRSAPFHRLGADQAGNPYRRMPFLGREHPRISETVGGSFAPPSRRTGPRPLPRY